MTRLVQYSNNATSKLAANLTAVGLTCTITPGEGAKFPALTGSQYFYSTLIKADGTKEIVKVTARATDTFTIVRAAEAIAGVQTSYAFSAGDKIELRPTAGMLSEEFDRLHAAAYAHVANKSANYSVLEADLNTLIRMDTTGGARAVTLPLISSLVNEFECTVAKVTSDGNPVNVNASGADLINGVASTALTSQYQAAILIADKATNTWTLINSGSGGSGNKVVDTFVGAGTAGPFTLSGSPGSKNNTDVFVGGVYQRKSTYTLVGTQLTLGGSVAIGVPVECEWAQPVAIGVPGDGTVTTAKIVDGAVTTAKIDPASYAGIKAALGIAIREAINDFRLTLTTGTPVTVGDVTGASAQTLYLTPYLGNRISTYSGSVWTMNAMAEKSIAVPATTATAYDVFLVDGTLALELLAWTNLTTRATALTRQDGVLVKSGDPTRRYVGSFRTGAVSGQTEDSALKRYVWNHANRVARFLKRLEGTGSWGWGNGFWHQANASTANQVEVFRGLDEDVVDIDVQAITSNNTVFAGVVVGIGLDSTTVNSGTTAGSANGNNSQGGYTAQSAAYSALPGIGHHYFAWLEYCVGGGTGTCYGNTAPFQSGIYGKVMA